MSPLSRQAIEGDIDRLVSVDHSHLLRILNASNLATHTAHATSSTINASNSPSKASASMLIDTFRPRTLSTDASSAHNDATNDAALDQAIALSKAYIGDMNDVKKQNDGRLDRLGERLDKLREEGSQIAEALGGVII